MSNHHLPTTFNPDSVEPVQANYPEPIPLLPEVEKGKPYPIDALPSLMANAAKEIAQSAQAPIAMAAQCVIGAVAHLGQSRINANHPKDPYQNGMPASLLLLTLGDSGDGKSRCRDLAFKAIDEAERKRITEQRKNKEDLLAEARQLKGVEAIALREEAASLSDGKTLFDDVSVEGLVGRFIRGMPVASWDTDEGGQFFGGYSLQADTRTNTLGVLTKIYDKGITSRTRSVTNEEGSGTAYDRRLTVHILAQEVAVKESLADPLMRGQGLLARFLFAAPESLAGTRMVDIDLLIQQRKAGGEAYKHLGAYWERCKQVLNTPEAIEDGEVKAPVIDMTEGAVRALLEFDNRIEQQLAPLGDYFDIKAFARRGLEQAARLAALFAYFEGKGEVDAAMADQAIQVAQHSLDEWTRYSSGVVVSPLVTQAVHFMEWVQQPERADKWQVFTGRQFSQYAVPKSLRPAKTRDKALAILVEHNHLLVDGKTFRVNPLVSEATKATKATVLLKASNHEGCRGLRDGLHIGYTQATKPEAEATKTECSPKTKKCSPDVAQGEKPPKQAMKRDSEKCVAHVAHVAPRPKEVL